MTRFAPVYVPLRNSSSGSIGSRRRRSITMKLASATAETTKEARMRPEVQPYVFASMSPYVNAKSPIAELARPGRSRLACVSSRDSSMKRNDATIPRSPIGTLMKKIQLQSRCSVMSPPASGPMASARADVPAQMPIAVPALARRERGGDDRERRRIHEGGSGPLQDARADQHRRRRGEAAHERREREDDDAEHEDPPASVGIGHLAADEHERREGQRVARHDPLELGEIGAEVALDRGQRDVHHRVVEHDHEEPEGDGGERQPLAIFLCEDPRPHGLRD